MLRIQIVPLSVLLLLTFATHARTAGEAIQNLATLQAGLASADTAAQNAEIAVTNALAARANGVSPQSFIEQYGLIGQQGVEIRRDWHRWAADQMQAPRQQLAEAVAAEPKLFELYVMLLQVQAQMDSDDLHILQLQLNAAKLGLAASEQRLVLAEAVKDARALGVRDSALVYYRWDGDFLWMHGAELHANIEGDLTKAESLKAAAQKTYDRVFKEAAKVGYSYDITHELIAQAEARQNELPESARHYFARPAGYPVIERSGKHYNLADWQKIQSEQQQAAAKQANKKRPFLSLCGRLLITRN